MPHCRCRHCHRRQTLARHPEEYLRVRYGRCRFCRDKRLLRVDKYRDDGRERKRQGKPCNCLEYSFPHRKGSGWCQFNPNRPVDQEREAYA